MQEVYMYTQNCIQGTFIPHCKALPSLYYKTREWSLVRGSCHFVFRRCTTWLPILSGRVYHLFLGFASYLFLHHFLLRSSSTTSFQGFSTYFVFSSSLSEEGCHQTVGVQGSTSAQVATLCRVEFCNVYCTRPSLATGARELPDGGLYAVIRCIYFSSSSHTLRGSILLWFPRKTSTRDSEPESSPVEACLQPYAVTGSKLET